MRRAPSRHGSVSSTLPVARWLRRVRPRIVPAPPIERMDPVLPMHRMEPVLPIERIEPAEPMLRMDPAEPIDPIEANENNDLNESAENSLPLDRQLVRGCGRRDCACCGVMLGCY